MVVILKETRSGESTYPVATMGINYVGGYFLLIRVMIAA